MAQQLNIGSKLVEGALTGQDHEARTMAQRALDRSDGHEDSCAERYAGILTSIGDLKNDWKVASRSIIGASWVVIVSLIGFIFLKVVLK